MYCYPLVLSLPMTMPRREQHRRGIVILVVRGPGGRTAGALYSGWTATATSLWTASPLCSSSTLAAMTVAMTGSPVTFLSISALSEARFTSSSLAVMETSIPAYTLSLAPVRVPETITSSRRSSSLSSSVIAPLASALSTCRLKSGSVL